MIFIDLYKDGKLDLLTQLSSYTSEFQEVGSPKLDIKVYYNNQRYDAFFMKVTVLIGNNYVNMHGNRNSIGANVNCYVTSLSG